MNLQDLEKLDAQKKLQGIFQISNSDYHAAPGLSNSHLVQALRSPAHYKEWLDNKPEPTAAMKRGTRLHCALLEPDRFESEFLVMPEFSGKGSRAEKDEWLTAHEGKEFCKQEEKEHALRFRDALMARAQVRKLLTGVREISAFCYEVESGLLVKARTDNASPLGWIVDLKTCSDCSPEEFSKTIARDRYHMQNIFHKDVFNQTILKTGALKIGTNEIKSFQAPILLAAEFEPPFCHRIYAVRIEDLETGFHEYKKALEVIQGCKQKNEWPVPIEKLSEIALPKWYNRAVQYEDLGE